MRVSLFLIVNILFFQTSFSQNGEELNIESKNLIENGKFEEAFPILKRAAELGSSEAQYNLGLFFQHGVVGEKSDSEAVTWYKKSSDNGFNDGHYAMMMAYGNGSGVEKNTQLAFNYALKCARNDDATCMWNVANCYLTGIGVSVDVEKYKEWVIKLAKLPNPENLALSGNITSARLHIAQSYSSGEHFEQDNYLSYVWYLIYNESKFDFSVMQQQEIIKEIKTLEMTLTEEQIKRAPKDAEEVFGRKLNNTSQLYINSL